MQRIKNNLAVSDGEARSRATFESAPALAERNKSELTAKTEGFVAPVML
jgi:hypothetical protein